MAETRLLFCSLVVTDREQPLTFFWRVESSLFSNGEEMESTFNRMLANAFALEPRQVTDFVLQPVNELPSFARVQTFTLGTQEEGM